MRLFGQSFRLAIKSLMLSKARAILTMLGIIIGVAAVIAILAMGNGMTKMMNDEFESLGTNLLIATIGGRGSSRSVDVDDMYTLVDEHPDELEAVSPYVAVQGVMKYGTDTYSSTISGVSEDYASISRLNAASGRFIQYSDCNTLQHTAVVGSYLDRSVFHGNSLGQTIKINGTAFTVVGVLEEKADSTEGSNDDVIYIPYTCATRLNRNSSVSMYYFSTVSGADSVQPRYTIEHALYKIFDDDDAYTVVSMAEVMDAMNSMMGTMMKVIAAIAAISLVVGGIGIMNIMLVTVTERTKEIGIRKSLGAKRNAIRMQFVVEAATTSAIGGVIGIILGILGAFSAGKLLDMTAVPTIGAIALAFGVSVAIGIGFGYLPANKAAMMQPIDALRSE